MNFLLDAVDQILAWSLPSEVKYFPLVSQQIGKVIFGSPKEVFFLSSEINHNLYNHNA
jgi:hypothetical protein